MASAIYVVDESPVSQDIKTKRSIRQANPEPTLGVAQTFNGKNYDNGNKVGRHRSSYLKQHQIMKHGAFDLLNRSGRRFLYQMRLPS
jgi:hypothetical protein